MKENGRRIEALTFRAEAPLLDVLARQAQATSLGLPAGIVLIVDEGGRLVGTVTDGDVRRALLEHRSVELPAAAAMRPDPIVFQEGTSFGEVLRQLPGALEARGRRASKFLAKIVLVDEERRPTRVLDYHQLLEQRVASHRHVVVVGLGYVGLTLALVMADLGFEVTGVEANGGVARALSEGRSHVHEPNLPELLREHLNGGFRVVTSVPREGDTFILAVGTPVREVEGHRVPDLGPLAEALEQVGEALEPGDLVILRSTVPIGSTRSEAVPRLEKVSGLVAGTDFHVAFAPERTIEGSALTELRSLPQIIGGLNEDSTEAAAAVFRELTPAIVRMETLEAAELAKLVNNGYRDLSFAFSNEVVQLAAPYNFDVAEAIRSANLGYPRDPVPLPSPGVGGPCLSKDPYILASATGPAGLADSLSGRGRRVNEAMVERSALAVMRALAAAGKDPAEAVVLLCGIAFKGRPETADVRDSTALAMAATLRSLGIEHLRAYDPIVTGDELSGLGLEPTDIVQGFRQADAVLLLNNHHALARIDIENAVRGMRQPAVVFDGWGLFRPDDILRVVKGIYVGLGFCRTSLDGAEPTEVAVWR